MQRTHRYFGRWGGVGRLALVALLCAAFVPVLPLPGVQAAGSMYYVGTTDNSASVTTGCTSATNITCTLRGALSLATSGSDTVTFSSAFPQGGDIDVRPGASGGYGLNLTHSLTLNGGGKGPVLDGKPNGSSGVGVILVNTGITVSLIGLTIQHGTPAAGANGGGIFTYGTLNITGSTLTGNAVSGGGEGGGIYVYGGATTITDSTLAGNSATTSGFGGAITITNAATLTSTNTTIASNTAMANSGGGIFNDGGTSVTLNNTLVVNNTGGDVAGTISPSSIDYLTGSFTFASSLANNGGPTQTLAIPTSGPAYQAGDLATCESLSNRGINGTTYTGSTAVDQRGAPRITNGKCSIGAFEPGQVQTFTALATSTTSTNYGQPVTLTATVQGVLGGLPGSGTVAFTNGTNAIAGCTAQSITGGVATCTTSALPPGSDSITATYTAASATASYATSPASNTVTVVVTTIPCVVTSTHDPSESGQLTLRDAINAANAGGCTGNAITFDTRVFASAQTITLASASGTLTLAHNVTITGPTTANAGVTVSGDNAVTVFHVNSGVTATLANLTIANGNDASSSGGGGIFSQGTLAVTGCAILNNTTNNFGGGINNNGGTLTVTNSTIAGNTASGTSKGGGIENAAPNGVIMVIASTITGNHAATLGGGIRNYTGATVTLTRSIVAGNTAANGEPDISNIATLTDGGNNVVGIGDGGAGLTNGMNGDKVGSAAAPLNALLAAVGSYGGPTQTAALLPGSPAIDTGSCASGVTTDQRGVTRPQGASCDSGAFESRGFAFANATGGGQSATVTTDFATSLALTVTSGHNEPVSGGTVTFTITPGSGMGGGSGSFAPPGSTGCTVSMDHLTATCPIANTGVSTAPAIKAGQIPGTFTVAASTAGVPASGNVTFTFTVTSSAGLVTPQPMPKPTATMSATKTAPEPTRKPTASAATNATPLSQPMRH